MSKAALIDWFTPLAPSGTAKSLGTMGTVGTPASAPQKTAVDGSTDPFPPKGGAVGTVGTAQRSVNPVPTVPSAASQGGNKGDALEPEGNCASPSAVPTVPTVPARNDTEPGDAGEFDERVAIIATSTGAPIEWCTGLARLDPNRPPGDVPAHFWIALCDAAGVFVDRWAARAADLGWSVDQVFGCDRHAPFARLDRQGLVWSLVGGNLVDLSEREAVIEMPSGSRLKFQKRRHDPEPARAALVWDHPERGEYT